MSACAADELPLLLLVLREMRPAESASTARTTFGAAGWSATGAFSFSAGGSGTIDPAGVGFADESADEEVSSSVMGGKGRVEISGSGLYEYTEVGVVCCCCGGHSRSGGRVGTFSLCTGSLSLSFSLESPRLMRLRNAFMVARSQGCARCPRG